MAHYNQGRPHASLGPGIPDVPPDRLAAAKRASHPRRSPRRSPLRSWRDCITNIAWSHWRLDGEKWFLLPALIIADDRAAQFPWAGGLIGSAEFWNITRSSLRRQ